MRSVAMSAVPTMIGPYRVRRQLGRGGMGVVYLARDEQLERDVALISIRSGGAEDDERLADLRREARIVAQLNHPHIVQIHQLVEDGDDLYLVLEFLPGRSLADALDADGALDARATLALGVQIARALEAAHRGGVVHRDLKPSNVWVTDDGTAKVLDFGIATWKAGAGRAGAAAARAGTPGYMAPEQLRGDEADERAAIFAFGCVLYECLAGAPAFGADTADVLGTYSALEPDWSLLPDGLPSRVSAMLEQCVARDVDERLASMREVRATITAALGRLATPGAPGTPGAPETPPAGGSVHLPLVATSFVGRETTLHDLAHALGDARLITLTGGGGCGKTRLALELGRRVGYRFPGGVHLVELASIAEPAFVAGAVAAALGVKDRPNRTTTETLAEHVAARALLLIVDNCEHVLGAAADLVTALLAAVPALRIVATSREPLGVTGEHRWPIEGLDVPAGEGLEHVTAADAATLFVDRARAIRPAFALDPSNTGAVARLCRRLDGMPLAIELAAARVGLLTPAEIERRLDDRFRLLADPSGGHPERHRTLRTVVDWSYQTLVAREQRLLRVLSVFAGAWTLEDAVAVAAPGGGDDGGDLDDFAVLDLLTQLLNKSLLVARRADGRSHYRLLETVRVYAAEALDAAGEGAPARERHLDHYLAVVEEAAPKLTESEQAGWLERIEEQHDNILAALDRCDGVADRATKALRMCRAMVRFWHLHGHYRRGIAACRTALGRAEARPRTAERAGTLHAGAVMAQAMADYDQARAFASEALVIRREIGDRRGVAQSLNSLGNSAYYRGEHAVAKELHEESMLINRELGDRSGIATSLNNLGNIALDQGRPGDAERLYQEALEANRAIGNRASEAINLNNLGIGAYYAGDRERARRRHEASLAIRRELGARHGIAESLGHLGRLARGDGDLDGARRRNEESLTLRRDLGDRLGMADALDEAALLAAALGEVPRAARILGAGERLRAQIGTPRPESEQGEVDRGLAPARACEEALSAGRALTLEAVVEETLAWLHGDGADARAPTRVRTAP